MRVLVRVVYGWRERKEREQERTVLKGEGGGFENLNVGAWESAAFAEDDEAFFARNVALHEVLRWGQLKLAGGNVCGLVREKIRQKDFSWGSSVPILCRIGNEIKNEWG